MKYRPWLRDNKDDSLAWIRNFPSEINKKRYLLDDGISVKEWFPKQPVIELYKGKGIKLSDAVPNYDNFLIISEKLKKILEEKSNANFEFFPIIIKNLKGHIVKEPYFIANLLDTIECVDLVKSDFIMDAIIKTQVDYFKRLVLNETKIDPNKVIFRLKEKTNLIIINEILANEIIKNNCTGMVFQEIENYGEIFRD